MTDRQNNTKAVSFFDQSRFNQKTRQKKLRDGYSGAGVISSSYDRLNDYLDNDEATTKIDKK